MKSAFSLAPRTDPEDFRTPMGLDLQLLISSFPKESPFCIQVLDVTIFQDLMVLWAREVLRNQDSRVN